MLKLYSELATWWPLLSPVEEYADEATFFANAFIETGLPPAPTLLELGSGGGNNAFYMKKFFPQTTLTDLSPDMLAMSRLINPECEHLEGDMRMLRLGREFDAVFIHDAIDYMTTRAALREAIETAFLHCKVGGVAMFVPDNVRETFEPETNHAGQDGEGRALRYLEWSYDPDDNDETCVTEYIYALREGNQPTRVEHEQHLLGLFPRAEWLRLLQDVGFQPRILHDDYEREVFLAVKKGPTD